MSKPRSKKPQKQPRDVSQHWLSRGYRADIATSNPTPNEDPQGEAAYQRAFHSAAELSPPMLPNPSHYPNSPSAREYMRKKSMDFLAPRSEKRSGDDNSDLQSLSQKYRDPDRSPLLPSNTSSSTSPASTYSQNAKMPSPSQYSAYPDSSKINSSFLYKQPPAFLEPSGAPLGPMNKLK